MNFSIVICTHNRCEILHHSLNSIKDHSNRSFDFEVIVVDNASSDATPQTVESFSGKIPNLIYIYEPDIGLSIARNRGAKEAQSEWIFYMDDDVKIRTTTINEIQAGVTLNAYELMTGIYQPWYIKEKPIWMPDNFGSYQVIDRSGISDLGQNYVSGGVMLVKKSRLRDSGYFPEHLGMKGSKISYGEETYIENYFKENGLPIGINTNLVVDHLVGLHKYKMVWHFKSSFAQGRDGIRSRIRVSPKDVVKSIFNVLIYLVILPVRSLKNVFTSKSYSVSKYVYDTVCPLLSLVGIVVGNVNSLTDKS